MIVEFEWSDELGESWMNMDNLKLLLYGQMYTKPELLNITMLDHSDLPYKDYSVGKPEDCPSCGLCGKPMPKGEEMFQYHGYSGPCPNDDSDPITWLR